MSSYDIFGADDREVDMLHALMRLAVGEENCQRMSNERKGSWVRITFDRPTDRLRGALAAYEYLAAHWSGLLWGCGTVDIYWRDL